LTEIKFATQLMQTALCVHIENERPLAIIYTTGQQHRWSVLSWSCFISDLF